MSLWVWGIFLKGEARLQTHTWKSTPPLPFSQPPPPPPPTPSNRAKDTHRVFWPPKIKILCCLEMDRGRGVEFHAVLSISFCILEKNTRTFLNTKRVDMLNFSRFWTTWKKSSYRAGLHRATQLLVLVLKFHIVPSTAWGFAKIQEK